MWLFVSVALLSVRARPIDAAMLRLSELTPKCLALSSFMPTVMFENSCYALVQQLGQYDYAQQMARCHGLQDMPDGHLPWNDFQLGVYRSVVSTSLTYGDGWYLVGASLDDAHGPLPEMLNRPDIMATLFGPGEPNRMQFTGAPIAASEPSIINYNMQTGLLADDTDTQVFFSTALCQWDARPVDVHFTVSTACMRLNTASSSVTISNATSELSCAYSCQPLDWPLCTAFSFDAVDGCRHGRLARLFVNDECDVTAASGIVFVLDKGDGEG